MSVLVGYLGFESLSVLTNLPTVLEVKKNETQALVNYQERHRVFYILQKPDPTLGFVPVPEAMRSDSKNPIDEFGWRNKPGEKELADIVAVGDSFVYAFGVDYGDSWTQVLSELSEKTVSNLGVIAYSPWQYTKTMEKFPDYFTGRIILYGLYVNDFNDTTRDAKDYYSKSGRKRFKNSDPSFFDLVNSIPTPLMKRTSAYSIYTLLTKEGKTKKGRGCFLSYGGNEINPEWLSPENMRDVYRDIDEAARLADRYATKIIFILFPSKLKVYEVEYRSMFGEAQHIELEDRAFESVRGHLDKNNLPFIDLVERLTQASVRKNPFFDFDAHLNSYGNRVVAEEITCFLVSTGHTEPTKPSSEFCYGTTKTSTIDF